MREYTKEELMKGTPILDRSLAEKPYQVKKNEESKTSDTDKDNKYSKQE